MFYVHAGVFAGSMAVNLAVNLLVNLSAGIAGQWSAWWSVWAFIGCGAGIAVHGLVVRLNRPSLSSTTWEQRQIDRMLGELVARLNSLPVVEASGEGAPSACSCVLRPESSR